MIYDRVDIKQCNNDHAIGGNEDQKSGEADIACTSSVVAAYAVMKQQLRGADHHTTIFYKFQSCRFLCKVFNQYHCHIIVI